MGASDAQKLIAATEAADELLRAIRTATGDLRQTMRQADAKIREAQEAEARLDQRVAEVISRAITQRVDAVVEVLMDEAREEVRSIVAKSASDVLAIQQASIASEPSPEFMGLLRALGIKPPPQPRPARDDEPPIKLCSRVADLPEPSVDADIVHCDVCEQPCWSDRHTPGPVRIVCGPCINLAYGQGRTEAHA